MVLRFCKTFLTIANQGPVGDPSGTFFINAGGGGGGGRGGGGGGVVR